MKKTTILILVVVIISQLSSFNDGHTMKSKNSEHFDYDQSSPIDDIQDESVGFKDQYYKRKFELKGDRRKRVLIYFVL